MKQHVKAICAGVGYSIAFHAGSWVLAVLYTEQILSDFFALFLTLVFWLIMLPVYIFVLEHMQKRWNFRVTIFLSFALLHRIALLLIARFETKMGIELYAFFAYLLLAAISMIFLVDMLMELFRYIRRRMRNRTYKNDPPRQILP